MNSERIEEITVLSGKNRLGEPENFDEIIIRPGDTLSIVGPTGSGKSAFITDIEIFARNDTATGRTILVNGALPPEDYIRNPAKKPVALITQNTKCLADLRVHEFLAMHIKSRSIFEPGIIETTIDLANEFTGEKVHPDIKMTALSGGQTRSLMVADAITISNTPLILLDEVENAGIFKDRVIEILKEYNKALIFVTHDPMVSLMSDRRIVMKNGGVSDVLEPNGREEEALLRVIELDQVLCRMREQIRAGEMICSRGPP
jgi:ABC-type lipoprotein export system ATPase subunit